MRYNESKRSSDALKSNIHALQRRHMKKATVLLAVSGLLAGLLSSATAYNGKMLTGKAVSVHFHCSDNFSLCESQASPWRGSIVVYTIQNSTVTRADTVYRKELGYAHYAAFNLSGTKIAFYRFGQAPSAGGGCVSVNGGKSYISLINPDGTGLTDLCELPALPSRAEIFPLDWPGGDWIYYTRPHDAAHTYSGDNGSTVIWRVNFLTKANELVCNLTDNGTGIEEMCNSIRRFTLSVDGKHTAIMYVAGGKGGCTADVINNHENNVHLFPPSNCAVKGTCVGYCDGCNISISPSGKIVGSYFAGAHEELMLGSVDYTRGTSCQGIGNDDPSAGLKIDGVWINYNRSLDCPTCIMSSQCNLTKWSGEFIGRGAELIRWSANSDKWVMQKIGNGQDGHAGDNDNGSNQLLCNLVDSVAINISKNPPPPVPYPAGYVFQNNDAGDLWISDPANNPGGDRYEDLQGRWHSVDGTIVVSHIAVTPVQIYFVAEKDSTVSKTLAVSNSGAGTLNAIATTIKYGLGGADWLSATTSGSGNSQQIALQFKTSSLPENTYHATLIVSSPGTADSALIPVDILVMSARNPDNPSNAVQGLAYKYYQGRWFPAPNFDTVTAAKTGACANFKPFPIAAGVTSGFGLRYFGFIDIPAQGMYTFTISADGAARLSVGGLLMGECTWVSPASGSIPLKAGKQIMVVDFIPGEYGMDLSVSWECAKAGIARQAIPANRLYYVSGMSRIASRPNPLSKPAATMLLYTLQGKRIGTLANGTKSGMSGHTAGQLMLAAPEKPGDRTGKAMVIVR
jgi:hypothetical protein